MKIRVLEVLASLRRAGAERVVVSLACGLDRARFETEVVSLYDAFPDGFEPVLADAGVAVRHLGKHRGLDIRMVPRLARAIREFQPAIVHSHSYVMRYVLPAGWWAGRPRMVHTVHNLAEREVDGIGRAVHRAAFRAGAAAVAVSGEVAKSFRRIYGFDPAAVIPNGVDLVRFGRGAGDWRRTNGFKADDGLIVSVARFEPQKNPLRLIEAFARGLKDEPRWRLLLAGGGSLERAAREAAGQHEVAGRVHFLGVRTDIAELLAACDIFALAADWEGSPMAVIEAMASGLPVAATAVGGVPELVEHGATGLLTAPGDTAALAQSLAALARDAKLRAEFGARGARKGRTLRRSADDRCLRATLRARRGRWPMTRVVLLTTNLARGGAEIQVAQLALELRERGWEVSVVSLVQPTALESDLREGGVPVFWAPPAKLLPLLLKLRPQILHAHLFHANIAARMVRMLLPVPVVISTIHSLAESSRRTGRVRGRDWLYRLTDPLADQVVCVSQAAARRHLSAHAVSATRLRVIPNGIHTARFRPDPSRREATRAALGLDSEFVWLAAGRLMWKKNYPLMLEAAAQQPDDATLLIAGEGPDEADLKRQAAARGVRARFLGARDDLPVLMNAADALVLSSAVEGLPMVLLEAAASGLPQVAVDVGGVAEALVDGRTGYVVPPADPNALAAAMTRLAALPVLERAEMGLNAREHVLANFDLRGVAARWEQLYEDLLRAERRSSREP